MDEERNEVYERIPWETLESKGGDRQRWMFALAGAIVLGALAYSFMSGRPGTNPAQSTMAGISTLAQGSVAVVTPGTVPLAPVPETAAPVLVAEADLYAVAPARIVEQATAHAEWFAAEYIGVDGSEESRLALAALMPVGVPEPPPPESTRVFVEWVRAMSVEELEAPDYRVTVLVRSLVAVGEEPYHRQAPFTVTVDVRVTEAGPQVMMPPVLGEVSGAGQMPLTMNPVPVEIEEAAVAASGASAVVGGIQSPGGGWMVVAIAPGPDGVPRPITVPVP
jgi:hypothetical protein